MRSSGLFAVAVVSFIAGCTPSTAPRLEEEAPITGSVVSRDDAGNPRFAWASTRTPRVPAEHAGSPAAAARWYADRIALSDRAQGISSDARQTLVHDTGRGGIVVTFEREVAGVPVFGESMKVL